MQTDYRKFTNSEILGCEQVSNQIKLVTICLRNSHVHILITPSWSAALILLSEQYEKVADDIPRFTKSLENVLHHISNLFRVYRHYSACSSLQTVTGVLSPHDALSERRLHGMEWPLSVCQGLISKARRTDLCRGCVTTASVNGYAARFWTSWHIHVCASTRILYKHL